MKTPEFEDVLEEVDSAYGRIAFFRNDMFLGRSLREYGEWAKKELDFLDSLIVPGSVVVDVGAFIGTHTLAFSRFVGERGIVYAFEPHPTYFRALQRNITSNQLSNVFPINCGLSDRPGEMQAEELDLYRTNSLGSVQLAREIAHGNKLTVKVTILDSLNLKTCSLIKVDVEGMENLVLAGGRATIERCKPIIYAECNSSDAAWPVVQMMHGLRYVVYLYSEVAYNPDNFRKNALNIFGSARELALVCVPSENNIDCLEKKNPYLEIIRIDRLDDLVLALIKKPQYKEEVLASTSGVKVWGNSFWANEGELEHVQLHIDSLEKTNRELSFRVAKALEDISARDAALKADRDARAIERCEAVKQIQAFTDELVQLRVAYEAEQEACATEQVSAQMQIAKLSEAATKRKAECQSHVAELESAVWSEKKRSAIQLAELNNLRQQLERVISSRSWRLTAPLRRLLTFTYEVPTKLSDQALAAYRTLPITPSQRQKLKNFLFAFFGFAFNRMDAYKRWQEYRHIQTNSPFAAPVAHETLSSSIVSRTIPVLQIANGIWEWNDYSVVKSRISQLKAQQLSQVNPIPLKMIETGNDTFEAVAARIKLPILPEEPDVSIILPVFNNLQLTLECLLSISTYADARVSFEVILTDDASHDETGQVVSRIANLRIVRNDQNLGFLRNCNKALEHARGRYVVYLNNDVQVTKGWLATLHETFITYPNVGAAGPKFVYPSGHLQEAGASFRQDGTGDMVGLNDDPNKPRYNYPRRVDYISGACLMLPADLVRQLGGFSEEFLPCYCEDSDLCLRVQDAGFHVYYNPASTIIHHLSKTTAAFDSDFKVKSISANLVKLQQKWIAHLDRVSSPRIIAFYLPQFHPFPENNRWWGNGFTEWTNVTKAQPNFVGHYQPRLPADLGFYDLRLSEIMQQQANLARRYGIHGFCFYYYWFGGKRLLEQPIEQMLTSGKPDMPFCLCWANENWTRRWDGQDHDILMAQSHSPEDDEAVINDLIRYFRDPRYIRIDGRPMILVYRATLFPDFSATVARWRAVCKQQEIGEIYVAVVESMELTHANIHPSEFGCDAAVEFPPQGMAEQSTPSGEIINSEFAGSVADYRDIAVRYATRDFPGYTRFKGVMPGWDNTARRQNNSFCFEHATPGTFQAWLEEIILQTRQQHCGDERLVFVNAWNEWAEGAYLEPDRRFGHTYLEAVKNATEAAKLLRRNKYWQDN